MSLSSRERRALAARGNRLKANLLIRAGELSEATVVHLQRAFSGRELIKVRVNTDDREACARVARQLAARIPCELVQQVGRVVLLYRRQAQTADR